RRAPAWGTGSRSSLTYSPGPPPARPPTAPTPPQQGPFPPLAPAAAPAPAVPQDKVLQALTGLIGTTITLSTKTAQRYEGSVASTQGEGDTRGVTLRDVREISAPDAPTKDQVFIASTNITDWASGPAGAGTVNGDSFKTDTDISQKAPRRERELQAWTPDGLPSSTPSAPPTTTSAPSAAPQHHDDVTFGAGAHAAGSWDQFAANERLFGVRAGFDEDVYTTRLDRSAADFKERERRAAAIANEIMGSAPTNPHVAEERVMNLAAAAADGAGAGEEERYGAVVRGQNAYVPPGARKPGSTNGRLPDADEVVVPKVAVNAPDGSAVPSKTPSPAPAKVREPFPHRSTRLTPPPADALPAFRDFVKDEKQRLSQKRQAIVKNEREKRMADLLKFSQSFKLNKPIPDDLVTILAKDEEKQKQIREKSAQDAASHGARTIGATAPSTTTATATPTASPATPAAKPVVPPSASAAKVQAPVTKPPAAATPPGKTPGITASVTVGKTSTVATAATAAAVPAQAAAQKKAGMYIQPIPPFKGGSKSRDTPSPAAAANGKPVQQQQQQQQQPAKLNVNASSFRPNPNAAAFTPTSPSVTASPLKGKETGPQQQQQQSQQQQQPQNPFFGSKQIKRQPVHVKDAFNPFAHTKVAEAASISA
ncbi:LsmAD domain-containing protein, partial [Vararia minispora EC-137]